MQLDLRLIIPGPDPVTVLLDGDGRLPAALVDGDDDEATVVAATAYLRDRFAFPLPILETHPQSDGVPDGAPIPVLVTTEPAAPGWTPPAGLAFGPPPTVSDALPASLFPRATELLAEIVAGSPPPELRPRWARRGWHARASAWMTTALAAAGRPLLEPPAPFYLRGISALLKGRTAAGFVFLKAAFPPFHHEPVVTRLLAGRFSATVPRVHAIEAGEGWLIVEDVGAPLVSELPRESNSSALAAGARAIVAIQRSLEGDLNAFVAAGCPTRPIGDLSAQLDLALGPTGVAHVEGSVPPERRERVVAATRAAVERVEALGFPETIVHGDFHPGNAAYGEGRVVIIDWSDAAIGNPAIDLVTWLSWSDKQPDDRAAAIDAWIEAWAGSADPHDVRAALDAILVVGSAYQVVSYDGIVRALEPLTRYTMAGGAKHFLERLEERLP